jgi:hypothetical protein
LLLDVCCSKVAVQASQLHFPLIVNACLALLFLLFLSKLFFLIVRSKKKSQKNKKSYRHTQKNLV